MEKRSGFVTLVGAGPGDAGLLTLAGRDAIADADVVLFDRLVGEGILAMIPPGAERVDVGKRKGDHPVPQDEINRLLVEEAKLGKRVVRLKGGDPYLFGRGAEELEGLIREGIPFRVVPGVTSALAVPAYAGIPLTHRRHASTVHILSGHAGEGRSTGIPCRELARVGGTLVFLMGVSGLEAIVSGLVREGMPPATPAALVENGTNAGQRRLTATVGDIAQKAREAGIASPAVLVVGEVCRLAEEYDWTRFLPLWGKRILAASSRAAAGRLAEKLRRLGAGVDEFAAVTLEPVRQPDAFWPTLSGCQWLTFTSAFGVETFFAQLREAGRDVRDVAHSRFAVVGARTAEELSRCGIRADFVPGEYNSAALARGLAALMRPGERAILFRARDGSAELPSILRDGGIAVDDVAAYDTRRNVLPPEAMERLRAGRYDAATFTSASCVEAFARQLPAATLGQVRAVCIGAVTAAKAVSFGMQAETSPEATLESMAAYLLSSRGCPV